jgi:CubicO group peptidase (beta-lactamase class C family)
VTGNPTSLQSLPRQPAGVPWPTHEWPRRDPEGDPSVAHHRLSEALSAPFGDDAPPELGLTLAVLVVHRGAIVAEAYGPGYVSEFERLDGKEAQPVDADTPLISWSMAKSMLHAAIGIAAREGRIDVDTPPPVPEWSGPDDPRRTITWAHLLHMASGLAWIEDYVDGEGSDVIEMLFGAGATDMAGFAASFPPAAQPDTRFVYSSGTSNILARALQTVLGLEGDADGMRSFLATELFEPLGMTSADPRFDPAGTFTASSYVYATARDFARFGLLYLRGGIWDGRTIVTPEWVDDARTPIPLDTLSYCGYGSHWWTHPDGLGTFGCHGYEGQRITCVPARDLVVVRLGKTTAPDDDLAEAPVDRYVDEIIACFGA